MKLHKNYLLILVWFNILILWTTTAHACLRNQNFKKPNDYDPQNQEEVVKMFQFRE